MEHLFDLQFFADAGTLVNATGNYVNASTGETTAFSGTNTLNLLYPRLLQIYRIVIPNRLSQIEHIYFRIRDMRQDILQVGGDNN